MTVAGGHIGPMERARFGASRRPRQYRTSNHVQCNAVSCNGPEYVCILSGGRAAITRMSRMRWLLLTASLTMAKADARHGASTRSGRLVRHELRLQSGAPRTFFSNIGACSCSKWIWGIWTEGFGWSGRRARLDFVWHGPRRWGRSHRPWRAPQQYCPPCGGGKIAETVC